jgi:hypothetical protein
LLAAITYYPLYLWLGTVTQPGNINYPIAIFIIFILVCYVGMVYGPVGAFLAEFPSCARPHGGCLHIAPEVTSCPLPPHSRDI